MPLSRPLRAAALVAVVALVTWIRVLPLGSAGPDARFRAADGREHVYLGDYDSYAWLRAARSYLGRGTTCDAVVDGDCRDTFTHAPLGRTMRYGRSPHIVAIVALHRLLTLVLPGFPLSSSAFLVPVLLAALAILPAFGIGRRLGGDVGGLVAALLASTNPIVLLRTAGSDNDVWNVVLPLWAVWAAVRALGARRTAGMAAWALLAAGLVGLHAATWQGWVVTYGVLAAGLGATLAVQVLRRLAAGRSPAAARVADGPPSAGAGQAAAGARSGTVRQTALVLTLVVAGGAAAAALAGSDPSPLEVPRAIVAHVAGWGGAPSPDAGATTWPDVFTTVGELTAPGWATLAAALGGQAYLLGAWLGLLALVLPWSGWRWWHFALLIAGTLLYRVLVTGPTLQRTALVAVLALPLAVAVVLEVVARPGVARPDASGILAPGPTTAARPTVTDDPDLTSGQLVIAIWFLAALLLAWDAMRFVMLAVAPWAVVLGVAVGRAAAWVERTAALLPRLLPLARAATAAAVLALVAVPVRDAAAAARTLRPQMNDAWWDTLTRLRAEAPPDTIVMAWWDYGYWVKYVAERPVLADGGSLRTHVPYWLGRALLTANEDESIGLLRMLACGSDATPEPEGRLGAVGRLVATGLDEPAAHDVVVELARLDADGARARLDALGLDTAARDAVLRATHCTPPPAYLVLGSRQIAEPGWAYLGRQRPGHPPDTSPLGYVFDGWVGCRSAHGRDEVECPLGIAIGNGPLLEALHYPATDPAAAQLQVEVSPGGDAPAPRDAAVAPRRLLIAERDRLVEPPPAAGDAPDVAVLIDVPGRRVALAWPETLLRATLAQLLLLDGRYARRFQKVDDRTAASGERVVTWAVRWEPSDAPATCAQDRRRGGRAARTSASPSRPRERS